MDLGALGRLLLIVAAVIVIAGLLLILFGKLGVGRLPGDLLYRREGVTIYLPLATSILISIILSLLLSFVFWLLSRGK